MFGRGLLKEHFCKTFVKISAVRQKKNGLGPLLFSLYINDISKDIDSEMTVFAIVKSEMQRTH